MSFNFPIFNVAAPETLLLSMLSIIVLFDIILPANKAESVLYWLAQTALVFAGTAVGIQYFYHSGAVVLFYGHYVLDNLALLLKLFIYVLSSLSLHYGRLGVTEEYKFTKEYYILCLFAILGMSVLCCAGSLLTIYLGLELLSLPIYTMIAACGRNRQFSLEAAIKYFVLGSIASAILLYGMSILYGATGSIVLNVIASKWNLVPHDVGLVSLLFILVALLLKFGLVPFHMWMPDVYQGAHNKITVFLAGAPKLAVFAVLLRMLVIQSKPDLQVVWSHILLSVAIFSMVVGNLVAIAQSSIKRMLAYSAIAHSGYVLVGLALAPHILHGYDAALFYLFTYSVVAIGAFGILIILGANKIDIDDLHDLQGLNARSPWLAFIMLLFMFSMAGIPPSPGFFAKLGLLIIAVQAQQVWLAVVMLLVALIGVYYYLRVVMLMYFSKLNNNSRSRIVLTWSEALVVSGNGLVVLMLGIWPTGIINLCRNLLT